MAEKTAAERITGSTGRAAADMTPRAAFGLLFGFAVGAGLNELGVQPWQIGGLATASTVLVAASFDEFIKPLLKK